MSVNEIHADGKPPMFDPDMLREANHRISNHLTLLVGMVQTSGRRRR